MNFKKVADTSFKFQMGFAGKEVHVVNARPCIMLILKEKYEKVNNKVKKILNIKNKEYVSPGKSAFKT